MSLKYTVHQQERKHKGYSTLDLVDVSYDKIHHDGQIRKVFELFTSGNCAAVLICHIDENKLYFVRQFRVAIAEELDPWMLEIVAGGIDEGETPEDAAKREVMEETGFIVDNLERIHSFFVSPGRSSEYMHLFYAETTERAHDGGGLDEESEDVEVIGVDVADIAGLWSQLHDAKTLIALQWFMKHKLT